MSRKPQRRRRILAALGLSLSGLLLAEAGLRWGVGLGDPPLLKIDNEIEYVLAPSSRHRRFGNRIEVNRYGMRSADHPPEPTAGERRVLLIGDSLIHGGADLDQSETIAARLTAKLEAAERLAGCAPLVMAAAAPSWGPANQAAFLRRTGALGAEAAVILISAHDLIDAPRFDAARIPFRTQPSLTAIGDFVTAMLSRLGARMASPDPRPKAERERITLDAMDEMATFLDAAGARPLIAYQPTTEERAGVAAPARAVFANWAAQRGLVFLDLGAAAPAPGGYLDTLHPDTTGAERIAAALSPPLLARLAPCPEG